MRVKDARSGGGEFQAEDLATTKSLRQKCAPVFLERDRDATEVGAGIIRGSVEGSEVREISGREF